MAVFNIGNSNHLTAALPALSLQASHYLSKVSGSSLFYSVHGAVGGKGNGYNSTCGFGW